MLFFVLLFVIGVSSASFSGLSIIDCPVGISAFKIWWDNWKIEKNKYSDIREWWDLAKNKIKLLTMEISRNLNCKQNKKEIEIRKETR